MPERLKRMTGYTLAVVFAGVGVVFLVIPGRVIAFFNGLWSSLGLPPAAGPDAPFFVVLAAAYMFVVTVLAWNSGAHPEVPVFPRLLAIAKAASSLLSFGYFAFGARHLILLVNGVVDGAIALLVLWVFLSRGKGLATPESSGR
ncbi:MAG: hypothetical protein ACXVI6_02220 [Candidatus Aminicenantales bacterium]